MKTMFKAQFYTGPEIIEVQVEKETEAYVVFLSPRGGAIRVGKQAEYHSFHATREEAKQAAIHRMKTKVASAEQSLAYHNANLEKAMNL